MKIEFRFKKIKPRHKITIYRRQTWDIPIYQRTFSAHDLIVFYPLLIILGKILRWTIMYTTLVGYSKGWGYPEEIINGKWSLQLFGIDELVEGDIGQGANIYSFFRIFWIIWLQVPNDFYSFEIMITLTWGLFLLFVMFGMKKTMSFTEGIFVVLSVIVISVYSLSLGKEPFQMIFFFLLYAVLHSKGLSDRQKAIGGIITLLLSICLFRTYYALIFVFGGALFFFLNRMYQKNEIESLLDKDGKLKWKHTLIICFLVTVVYLVMIAVLFVLIPDLYVRFRDALLYASNDTAGSHTYIENILGINNSSPNVITVWIEYIFALVRLCIPIELITSGPKYWPYILYQLCITYFMMDCLRNVHNNSRTVNIALLIFCGFVFGSATFEVDFGAWVRHCSVTFPLLLIMTEICPSTSKAPKEETEKDLFKWIN